MSHHHTSHNHRQTDASIRTTSRRTHHETAPAGTTTTAPSEIFALIDTERILVTITDYGWRTYIRRERPNQYTVRYENAAGVVSGSLALDRRKARRLVAEHCREAVWLDLQDQTEWPGKESTEVSD